MNNSFFSEQPAAFSEQAQQPWSPTNIVNQGGDWLDRVLGWWYKFTAPPRARADATFLERESDRKARLASTIGFVYLLLLVIVSPAVLTAQFAAIISYLISIAIIICALIANKAGKTTITSILLVLMFESGLASSIMAIKPLDATDVQLYDLFIVGELLAVSLLPVYSVFILALVNSVFVTVDLFYLPHTHTLAAILQQQGSAVLIRPIAIQIITACVTALWVYTSSKANERANRAEMIATLEHDMAEQRLVFEKEKQELEDSIQQLVQAHVDAKNGQIDARIPYPPAKVLWPLVGVVNSLWVRLQGAEQTERSMQQLEQAISSYTDVLQQATQFPQQPLTWKRTGTRLDPLILAIKTIHESQRRANPTETGHAHERS